MKEFEEIQKRMPYAESEDYLDNLVTSATEKAIRQGQTSKAKVRPLYSALAAAAAALLLVTIGVTQFRSSDEQIAIAEQESLTLLAENTTESAEDRGPIDDFLYSLSDEEVQMLAYYEMVDIPEYE